MLDAAMRAANRGETLTAPVQAANQNAQQTTQPAAEHGTGDVITGNGANKNANRSETVKVVENLQNSIPALSEMNSAAEVSTSVVQNTAGRTMAEKARQLFEKIVGVVNRPDVGAIEINKRSAKDDLSHGVGMAKAAVIPAIPNVLRNGVQIDYQQNWKGRAYDGYVFAAPVTLDGDTVYVAAVVKRTSKNTLYLHEVVDSNGNVIKIDDGVRANPTSLATNGDAGTQTSSSILSVPQSPNSVNQNISANDMGAMRSQFESAPKQSQTQSNTLASMEADWNVPESQRTPIMYDTISEAKSLDNARLRLAQDYAGEMAELRGKHNWSGGRMRWRFFSPKPPENCCTNDARTV